MNMTHRAASAAALAFAAAALGAAILAAGTGSKAPIGPAASAAGTKGDRLCGAGQGPRTDAACRRSAMAESGHGVSVRLVGNGTSVVERPMTDRERLEAAFAAFGTQTGLASRM